MPWIILRPQLHARMILRTANLLIFIAWASFAQAPAPGSRIPELRLPDQNGTLQTFESIRGPKGAMLVFYRSADWCAYCKSQLIEMEDSKPELTRLGLGIAAISYDPVPVLKSFADRKRIAFRCSRTKTRISSARSAFWMRLYLNQTSSTAYRTHSRS